MLILDLSTGKYSQNDDTAPSEHYPDEVLDSAWNPVLAEICSIHSTDHTQSKTPLPVIEASLTHLKNK